MPEQPEQQRATARLEARNGTQPLSSGEITTALVHLYRAEVGRSVRWRTRLDVTTNWAVLTTGAGMTFALGDPEPQRHVVILLSSLLVAYFLVIEARRYRHYDLWQRRVSLLEGSFYAPLLDPDVPPVHPAWRATLADSLREPRYQVPLPLSALRNEKGEADAPHQAARGQPREATA